MEIFLLGELTLNFLMDEQTQQQLRMKRVFVYVLCASLFIAKVFFISYNFSVIFSVNVCERFCL